mmetsp:Transcript_15913/g.51008  ORF Transcript_15913/g.51008 Transcript_15913/m.51008 type:complete len:240 (-) Transcript_15913:202-921(-)
MRNTDRSAVFFGPVFVKLLILGKRLTPTQWLALVILGARRCSHETASTHHRRQGLLPPVLRRAALCRHSDRLLLRRGPVGRVGGRHRVDPRLARPRRRQPAVGGRVQHGRTRESDARGGGGGSRSAGRLRRATTHPPRGALVAAARRARGRLASGHLYGLDEAAQPHWPSGDEACGDGRWCGGRRWRLAVLGQVTCTLPMEKANEAFHLMHEGKSIRTVLTFPHNGDQEVAAHRAQFTN